MILADYNLPQWTGMEALASVRRRGRDIPFILVTGSLGEVQAVECMRQGVTDYILKDNLARLPVSVRRAIREKSLREQRKQAEAALRESQDQLQAIIQSAMDAILTVDEEQRIVLFNPAAEQIFACTSAEAMGRSLNDFIPERFRHSHTAQVRGFAESNKTQRKIGDLGNVTGLRADGTECPLEVSISRVEVAGRKLVTAIIRDITRRKQAEEALHESQQQLRVLFNEMLMGFALFEPIYDETGKPCDFRYLEVNAAHETHCGLGRDRVMGKTIREILPTLEPFWIETYGKVATTGESIHFDSYAQPLDRWLELTVFRTCKNQVAVTFADISERKRSEEGLVKKADELARSNRDLEQFAYVASHDLQEPLRMVASYAQLLAERYRGKLDENADKYIGYTVEGALRMQTLVRDLLAFSRAGRNHPNFRTTDCNAVVDEAIQNLRSAIDESGAVITHGKLPVIAADPSQLSQVLQNLIGNAIKFRGKEPPAISVTVEKCGPEWQFAVTDNGIGIAPEHQQVIFAVFQRLHTRAEYPGNGIGLSICKKIVEHHGGKIWVESQLGAGCTLKFTLPVGAPQLAQGATA
jgi:PAS domain S-box-containing protein